MRKIKYEKKNQWYILHNHRVKFAKNGEILIPEDFYRARSLMSLRQHFLGLPFCANL